MTRGYKLRHDPNTTIDRFNMLEVGRKFSKTPNTMHREAYLQLVSQTYLLEQQDNAVGTDIVKHREMFMQRRTVDPG